MINNLTKNDSYTSLIQRKAQLEKEITTLKEKRKYLIDILKNKRWFLFDSPKEIVFDCKTGYLWENLESIDLIAFDSNTKEEILRDKNFANIDNWKISTKDEFLEIMSDKKYPATNMHHIITKEISLASNDFSLEQIYENLHYFLFCSTKFSFENFCDDFSLNCEAQKAEKILDIFISNNWIPIFNKDKLDDSYMEILKRLPILLNEHSQIEEKILEELKITNKEEFKIIKKFDFDYELKNYDLDKVERSIISYSDNVVTWLNNLINILILLKEDENKLLSFAFQVNQKVKKLVKNNINANKLIKERSLFLKNNLNFDVESTKSKFMGMKNQILNLKSKIENTVDLYDLAEFENIKYPSFLFIAEHSSKILNKKLESIDWFRQNIKITNYLLEIAGDWTRDFNIFIKLDKNNFIQKCKENSINEELAEDWFSDWMRERVMVGEKLLPMFQAILDDLISFDILIEVEKKLKEYRTELKVFYMNQRDNDEAVYDRVAYANELSKVIENFHKSMKELIFIPKSIEERIFITNLLLN